MHGEINAGGLVNLHDNVGVRGTLKTCFLNFNPECARHKIDEIVEAFGSGWLDALFAGGLIGDGYLGIGDSASRCVGNRSGDGAVTGLRGRFRSKNANEAKV